MTKPSTVVRHLDLDAIIPPIAFQITLNGEQHTLAEATVETYLENIRDVEKLGLGSSVQEETELSIRIVTRSFPTVPEAEIRKLKLSQIQKLIEFARGGNGESDPSEEPAADGSENPPTEAS